VAVALNSSFADWQYTAHLSTRVIELAHKGHIILKPTKMVDTIRMLQILIHSNILDGETGMVLFKADLITEYELFSFCNLTTRDLLKPGNPVLDSWRNDDILIKNGRRLGLVVSDKLKENYLASATPWNYEYLWASYYGRIDWVQCFMKIDGPYYCKLNGAAIEIAFEQEHYELIEFFMQEENYKRVPSYPGSDVFEIFVRLFLAKIEGANVEFVGNILDKMGTVVKYIFERSICGNHKHFGEYSRHGYPHLVDAAVSSGRMEMLELILNASCLGGFEDPESPCSFYDNDNIWLFGGQRCLLIAYENGRYDMLQKLLTSPFANFYLHGIFEDYYLECVDFLLREKIWIPTATQYRLLEDCFDYSEKVEKLIYAYLPKDQKEFVQRYNMAPGEDQQRRLKFVYQMLCDHIDLDDYLVRMNLPRDQTLSRQPNADIMQEVVQYSPGVVKHLIGLPDLA
jgi:hypothetical protein